MKRWISPLVVALLMLGATAQADTLTGTAPGYGGGVQVTVTVEATGEP